MIGGTLFGTFVADALPSRYLAIVFIAFAFYSAIQMLARHQARPDPSTARVAGNDRGSSYWSAPCPA